MRAPPQVKPKSEVRRPPPAAHLVIAPANSSHERDADRRAERALSSSSATGGQRGPAAISSSTREAASLPVRSSVGWVIASAGSPLETGTRREMERRFGEDFSHVRIHTGAAAARSAAEVGARAYTVGSHIAFGAGNSPSDRRLLAHELAHVAQSVTRERAVLFRQPKAGAPQPEKDKGVPGAPPKLQQSIPADLVVELRRIPDSENQMHGDNWAIILSGSTTEASARKLLWPKLSPFFALIKLDVAVIEPSRIGSFTISNLDFSDLDDMEPSIAKMFRDRGAVYELRDSPEIERARMAFVSHNSDLSIAMFGRIHSALQRATRGNRDLMLAFYRHYSTHDLESDEMSELGLTSSGDTEISSDLLKGKPRQPTSHPLKLLGSTLLHEFAHTPHGPKTHGVEAVMREAKPYAIERLFAERMGDHERVADIGKMWPSSDSLTMKTGSNKIFNRTYAIIAKLYEIIDSKGGAEAEAARRMSVEFISKNEENFGKELRTFISSIGY